MDCPTEVINAQGSGWTILTNFLTQVYIAFSTEEETKSHSEQTKSQLEGNESTNNKKIIVLSEDLWWMYLKNMSLVLAMMKRAKFYISNYVEPINMLILSQMGRPS